MKNSLSRAKESFDSKLASLDNASGIAREAKICSDRAIALLHSGKDGEAEELLGKARRLFLEILSRLGDEPELLGNFQVSLALQEYSEAEIFFSVFSGKGFPELPQVPGEALILGLADSAGELNRAFLEARIRGDYEKAQYFLSKAREISEILSEMDYPDFVVPGFRRKKDFVRGILASMLATAARSEGIVTEEKGE